MLKKVLLVVVLIIIGLVGYVALQPSFFRVERSTKISAPPAVIFAHVNDFHKWQEWSPWAKIDPKAVNKFEGPESGKGAKFSWSGNSDVGEGTMTITDSHPSDVIKIKIDFRKPFEASNTVEFTFETEGDYTLATWSMFGDRNFMAKGMGLVMDCDKMIGGPFEQGLAEIKKISEKEAKDKPAAPKAPEAETPEPKAPEAATPPANK